MPRVFRASLLLTLLCLSTFCLSACVDRAAARQPQDRAPSFHLPDLSGGVLDSSTLDGKVVVIDFWATWCGPCIAEIPDYSAFWKKNRARGVEVLGVVVESGEPAEIADFVRLHGIGYRQLLGDEKVQDAFKANEGLPTTLVIDTRGLVVARLLGSSPGKFDELQRAVDEALSARKP